MDPKTLEKEVDRIVKETIAKKISALLKCQYQMEKNTNFTNEKCVVNEPISLKYLAIPVVENGIKKYRKVQAAFFLRMWMRYFPAQIFDRQIPVGKIIFNRYFKKNANIANSCYNTIIILNKYDSQDELSIIVPEFNCSDEMKKLFHTNKKKFNEMKTPGVRFIETNINLDKEKFTGTKTLVFTIQKSKQSSMFDGYKIKFMFDVVLRQIMNDCGIGFVYFDVAINKYDKQNQFVESHALSFIGVETDSVIDILTFDPHGNYNEGVEMIQKSLEFAQKGQTENRVRIFQKESSCPTNFQADWEDKIGFCVAYNWMWLDCVLNIMKNIHSYNKKHNFAIDVHIGYWMVDVSKALNRIDDAISIVFPSTITVEESMKKYVNEKLEIILRFLLQLFQDYLKYDPQHTQWLFDIINIDLSKKSTKTIQMYNDGSTIDIETFGSFSDEIPLEKDISKPLSDYYLPRNYPLPELTYDSFGWNDGSILDNERKLEYSALRKFLNDDYERDCTADSDCLNGKLEMHCDKMDDNPTGICTPLRKYVQEECLSDEDCLSEFCDNHNMCRLKAISDDPELDYRDTLLKLENEYKQKSLQI